MKLNGLEGYHTTKRVKCEEGIEKESSPPPVEWLDCKRCGNCWDDVTTNPGTGHECSKHYIRQCTDTKHAPCRIGVVSTQASLLRDIFDSVNSLNYDGQGKDNVFKPLSSIYHCFIDEDEIDSVPGDRIAAFLNLLDVYCSVHHDSLYTLYNYYFPIP